MGSCWAEYHLLYFLTVIWQATLFEWSLTWRNNIFFSCTKSFKIFTFKHSIIKCDWNSPWTLNWSTASLFFLFPYYSLVLFLYREFALLPLFRNSSATQICVNKMHKAVLALWIAQGHRPREQVLHSWGEAASVEHILQKSNAPWPFPFSKA